MKRLLFLSMLSLIAAFNPAFGQQNEAERVRQERERRAAELEVREASERMRREGVQAQRELIEWARQKELENRRFKTKPLSKEEQKKIRSELAPNPADLAQYNEFLQQSKTGLFRLLPNRGCSMKYVVSAGDDCQNATYLGEFYSFQLKDYSNSNFFDLAYKDGELISKGDFLQGILVSLGDVPLENLSLASKGVKFLDDFEPQTEHKAFEKQTAEIAAGINFDGYNYAKSAKALLNTTYALRVVGYSPEVNSNSRVRENEAESLKEKVVKAHFDKRADSTMVFRIIRQDSDGSLSILWKELGRKKSPKITFN